MNPPIIPGLPVGWGSWLVLLIIPAMMWMFRRIERHYRDAAAATTLPTVPEHEAPVRHAIVVPVARLNKQTVNALRYSSSLSAQVTAVHVASDPEKADELEAQWTRWSQGIPLVVIESPYRSLTAPLLGAPTGRAPDCP